MHVNEDSSLSQHWTGLADQKRKENGWVDDSIRRQHVNILPYNLFELHDDMISFCKDWNQKIYFVQN